MIDVSDVLTDPDFTQLFSVTRSTRSVAANGRVSETTEILPMSGVIAPATPRQLERLAEGDRSAEIIAVYSLTTLTPGTEQLAPDLVEWRGRMYRVISLDDFHDYGGWCVALCAAVDAQGRTP